MNLKQHFTKWRGIHVHDCAVRAELRDFEQIYFFEKVMRKKIETLLEKFKRAKTQTDKNGKLHSAVISTQTLNVRKTLTVHGQRSNCFDRMC